MPKLDFSDFVAKNTLIFENVPVYRDGEVVPEQTQTWQIPPFSAATELAIRELERKALELLSPVDTPTKKGIAHVRTMAAYWAPMVAVMVKDPILSPEQLEGYPAALLRSVGSEAISFFRFGKLRSEMEEEAKASLPTDSD